MTSPQRWLNSATSRLSFFHMPASLKTGGDDGGCWRVDDDCQFNYAEMEIPALLGDLQA
jgi:hypothetical protein